MRADLHRLAGSWSGIIPEQLGYAKFILRPNGVSIDGNDYVSVHWDEDEEPTCTVVTMYDSYHVFNGRNLVLSIWPLFRGINVWDYKVPNVMSALTTERHGTDFVRELRISIPEDLYYEWFATKTQYL